MLAREHTMNIVEHATLAEWPTLLTTRKENTASSTRQ